MELQVRKTMPYTACGLHVDTLTGPSGTASAQPPLPPGSQPWDRIPESPRTHRDKRSHIRYLACLLGPNTITFGYLDRLGGTPYVLPLLSRAPEDVFHASRTAVASRTTTQVDGTWEFSKTQRPNYRPQAVGLLIY